MESLRGEPMVSYPSDSAVAMITHELCRAAWFKPKVLQVVSETSTLISLVAGGSCVAVVPQPVSALGTPGVVFRRIRGSPSVDLAVAWRSGDRRPLLEALIDVIRASVQHAESAHSSPTRSLASPHGAAEAATPFNNDSESQR